MKTPLEAQLLRQGLMFVSGSVQGQDQTEWLQVGSGEPFGPYDAVKLKGDGPSFSEMIVEDRNQA